MRNPGDLDGNQLETQVLSSYGATRLVAGAGVYRVDDHSRIIQTVTAPDGSSTTDDLLTDQHQNTDSEDVYAYSYTNWPERTIWTLGMGVERPISRPAANRAHAEARS